MIANSIYPLILEHENSVKEILEDFRSLLVIVLVLDSKRILP